MQKRADKLTHGCKHVIMYCTVLVALMGGSFSFTLQVKAAHIGSMLSFALNTERVEANNVSLTGYSPYFGGRVP